MKNNSTLTKLAFKWLAPDGKLNPCGFFSQRLCAAERKYDVGKCELLGV